MNEVFHDWLTGKKTPAENPFEVAFAAYQTELAEKEIRQLLEKDQRAFEEAQARGEISKNAPTPNEILTGDLIKHLSMW